MKLVYDSQKSEVGMSYYKLYFRTSYKALFLYGLLLWIVSILVLYMGWQQGTFVQILASVACVAVFFLGVGCTLVPMRVCRKTIERLKKNAQPIQLIFSSDCLYVHDNEEKELFTIPYDLFLDIKLNKDWIIFVLKPTFKNMMQLQERYSIPVLDMYRFPVFVGHLTIQEIGEIITLVKNG